MAQLTPDQMRAGVERLKRRIADLEAFDPQTISTGHEDSICTLEKAIEEALARVFGGGTADYARYEGAASLQRHETLFMMISDYQPPPTPVGEIRAEVAGKKESALSLLRLAVRGLEEDIESAGNGARKPAAPGKVLTTNQVFVVHGHDEAALQGLARFLEKLGLKATVLREQPDQGRTIIEKFEDCASDVGFAVVLLTPDDVGGAASATEPQARARQNVVFELGYFAGKLGRGKVCLLRKGKVEIPSDLYGVIYTDMDTAEGWKITLVREMKAARLDFDANRMWA